MQYLIKQSRELIAELFLFFTPFFKAKAEVVVYNYFRVTPPKLDTRRDPKLSVPPLAARGGVQNKIPSTDVLKRYRKAFSLRRISRLLQVQLVFKSQPVVRRWRPGH